MTVRWRMLSAPLLGTCAMLAAAHAADTFDPYPMSKQQFEARVHTIALRPLRVPAETHNAEQVREQFESMITATLRQRGYTVVPSSEFDRIWRQMSERLGGTYDPLTGDPIEDKYVTAFDYTGRELARLWHVDALLVSYIEIDDAPFDCLFKCSTWKEPLTWHDQPVPGNASPQKVWATYLDVVITDLQRVKLYGIRSGIEWTSLYVARGHAERPPERLYRDVDRNARAVAMDLEPIVAAQGHEAPPAPNPGAPRGARRAMDALPGDDDAHQ